MHNRDKKRTEKARSVLMAKRVIADDSKLELVSNLIFDDIVVMVTEDYIQTNFRTMKEEVYALEDSMDWEPSQSQGDKYFVLDKQSDF